MASRTIRPSTANYNAPRITHGLRSSRDPLPAGDTPEVRVLGDVAGISRGLKSIFRHATWIVHELREAPTLTKADNAGMVYAEIASRANAALLAVASGKFGNDRHGRAGLAAEYIDSEAALLEAVNNQQIITAHMLLKVNRAATFLHEHSLYEADGRLRDAVAIFGTYLNKVIGTSMTLAAMLSVMTQERRADLGEHIAQLVAWEMEQENESNT
jgi:hypothetical protein